MVQQATHHLPKGQAGMSSCLQALRLWELLRAQGLLMIPGEMRRGLLAREALGPMRLSADTLWPRVLGFDMALMR